MPLAHERLVFRHTVEGLFKVAFKNDVTPELKRALATVGIDLENLPSTCTAEAYGAGFELLRKAVYPSLPEAEASELMGGRFLDGYFSTAMGGVVKTLLRFMPVEKVVERAPTALDSGANFIKSFVQRIASRDYLLTTSDYSTTPGFLTGVVRRTLELSGARNTKVKVETQRGRELVFHITWE